MLKAISRNCQSLLIANRKKARKVSAGFSRDGSKIGGRLWEVASASLADVW